MTMTDELLAELTRTTKALKAYSDQADGGPPDPHHSAAVRATLDLSKQLAAWRRASSHNYNHKTNTYGPK